MPAQVRQGTARARRGRCSPLARRAERLHPRAGVRCHCDEASRPLVQVDSDAVCCADRISYDLAVAISGPAERCSTDLATEPTTAPCSRPRPRVVRHTTHSPSSTARRALAPAGSSSRTTCARLSPMSTPSDAAASARRRSASASALATLTVCSSASKRPASARAVRNARRANSDPSRGTSTYLTRRSGADAFVPAVRGPALLMAGSPAGPRRRSHGRDGAHWRADLPSVR